jgi:hypothetical protein
VLPLPLRSLVALLAPILVLGFVAGALRAVALRSEAPSRRRRTLQATWVLLLLAGVPLWLVLAAVLGIW